MEHLSVRKHRNIFIEILITVNDTRRENVYKYYNTEHNLKPSMMDFHLKFIFFR